MVGDDDDVGDSYLSSMVGLSDCVRGGRSDEKERMNE